MISALGRYAIGSWESAFTLITLLFQTVDKLFDSIIQRKFRWRLFIDQLYSIGVESVPVMVFSLLFISLMLIVEFSFHMRIVIRQDSLVPAFSTMLMVRELGPVVTCLLLASRVGSSIAAEIGTMKITDQIDSLRLLSIDPTEYLTVPRVLASVISAITLSLISVSSALIGGAILAAPRIKSSAYEFFNAMFVFIRPPDLRTCLAKAAVFGLIIPIVASHYGYRCRPGAQGVGDAATSSVVTSSLSIIVADFVLTYVSYAL